MTNTFDVQAPADSLEKRHKRRTGFPLRLHDQGGVLIALGAVLVFLCLTQPAFRTWSNVVNIVGSNSVALILALGATFVIISGGIDLSTAAVAAAAGMVFGLALQAGWPLVASMLAALTAGGVFGLANGLLIARARLSFLVVTLGMASIATSFALIVGDGTTVNVFAIEQFSPVRTFATGTVGGVSIVIVFDLLMIGACAFVLKYTRFGRSVFAIGSNSEAARMNGINVPRTTVYVYLLAGAAAGIASLIQVGRLTGAAPQIDVSLLNGVLAAVLIGGTSFSGGRGSIGGTALGVLFLGVVQNAMTLTDVSTFWRQAVNGALLIMAVWLGLLQSNGMSVRSVFDRYTRNRAVSNKQEEIG
ncbi:ABC transporter permease [Rhodococcus maanshanensis]|uniref:Ribose transport system permease protein n=1 Tax=Rhodococcus maanshanensis TaxID=183556 RepID=A0A1H7I206_9NOCA|nr:ABC transporter permease [Rhodococcus maanshanensis]SEK55857.1 ribose transport system permease protein [Rhodococcus maanshanensis]